MLVVKSKSSLIDVVIEYDHDPSYGSVCSELIFIPHERPKELSDLIPKCRSFISSERRGTWTFDKGSVVIYGDKYFIVKENCSGVVDTTRGRISVKNLCLVDDKTLEDVAKEVSEVFEIPYVKASAFPVVLALYYFAKIGVAEFVNLPKKIQQHEQKIEVEAKEFKELINKLLELAKTISPDQELELE